MQEYLIILKSWETSPAPPTKQPLTGKLSQRKQAEQEFELIKGLATSIAERQNKQHETADTHDESMSSLICDRIIGRTWAKNDKFGQTPCVLIYIEFELELIFNKTLGTHIFYLFNFSSSCTYTCFINYVMRRWASPYGTSRNINLNNNNNNNNKQCIVPSTNGNTIIPRGKQHRIFISSWSTTQLVFTQSTNDEFPLLPKGAAEFPKYI